MGRTRTYSVGDTFAPFDTSDARRLLVRGTDGAGSGAGLYVYDGEGDPSKHTRLASDAFLLADGDVLELTDGDVPAVLWIKSAGTATDVRLWLLGKKSGCGCGG